MGVKSKALGTEKKPMFGKKKSFIRQKPTKIKKTDIIDKDYTDWLCTNHCVITGKSGSRGTGQSDIHAHHIYGRYPNRNDYLQVPIIGYAHNVHPKAYHECGNAEFLKHHQIIGVTNIKDMFLELAISFVEDYRKETGINIPTEKLKRNFICTTK